MRRCQPLQSLYHLAFPLLPLPPPAPPRLHFRTLFHSLSPSPVSSSSSHLPRPHNSIQNSTGQRNFSSRSFLPRRREACQSQITTSPRRKLSSTSSSFLKAGGSGNSGRLGPGRAVASDEEGDLEREWELELDEEGEGQQQGQRQERQWQQQQNKQQRPEQLQPQQPQQPHQQEQQEQRQHQSKNIHNPTPISDAHYHLLADRYIDTLVSRLEEIQELREDLDCEYSVYSPFPFVFTFSLSLLPSPSYPQPLPASFHT